MHDKVFYSGYKKKVAVPVLFSFPWKIEWVVLHKDTTELLYRCILFVERGELFLLGQKQENPPPQARVEVDGSSSILV